MKKIIISLVFLFTASLAVKAQSEKYISAMKNNLAALDSSFRNPSDLLNLANNFERIANAEKNLWIPYYYAAFCQVNIAFMEEDKSKVDGIADKATLLISKADSLQPGNSEISCIKSMIASAQLMVNPMQRYMQYGPLSDQHLADAIKLDPANPRPHYLKGQGLKYTPEQFGGGCKNAVEELQKAMDKYNAFKPATQFSPDWGMKITQQLLDDCK